MSPVNPLTRQVSHRCSSSAAIIKLIFDVRNRETLATFSPWLDQTFMLYAFTVNHDATKCLL